MVDRTRSAGCRVRVGAIRGPVTVLGATHQPAIDHLANMTRGRATCGKGLVVPHPHAEPDCVWRMALDIERLAGVIFR